MMQAKKPASVGRTRSGLRPGFPSFASSGKRRTLVVAAANPWKFQGVLDSFLKGVVKQLSNQEEAVNATTSRKEQKRFALPPTFQRLGPELCCLLDPKNDRLVYLLGVDEAANADAVSSKLRALLRAAAVPYVHLMGIPKGLRTSLLREFPGGQPILTNVPLPRDVARALQQQQQQQQGSLCQVPGPHEDLQREACVEASQRTDSGQWAPGGVLEMLYGNAPLSPGATEGSRTTAAARGGANAVGDTYGRHHWDLPNEVLSRRKQAGDLMRWRKGASPRVMRHRGERAAGKFDWLAQALNTLSLLSMVPVTSNVVLIRNNVNASLGIDELSGRDRDGPEREIVIMSQGDGMQGSEPGEGLMEVLKLLGLLNDDGDSDSEEDNDDNGNNDEDVAVLHAVEDAEGEDDEGDGDDEEDGDIRLLLRALQDDDDSDDDDDGISGAALHTSDADDNEVEGGEGDEDGDEEDKMDAVMRALMNDKGDGFDAAKAFMLWRKLKAGASPSDAEEEEDGDGEQKEAAESARMLDVLPPDIVEQLGGSLRQIQPGVFVRVGSAGGDGDDEEDQEDNQEETLVTDWEEGDVLDVQLSPGPMGWTALLRLGREAGKRGRGGDTDREALRSLIADAQYMRDMGRLEALWGLEEQLQDSTLLPPAPQQQQADQGQAREPGPQPSRGGDAASPAPNPNDEGARAGAAEVGADGPSFSGGGIPAGLEADWRRAEGRAAAAARLRASATPRVAPPGLVLPPAGAIGTGASKGAVPTDRLMRPPRRPGFPASAAATSAAATAGADAGVAAAGGESDPAHGADQACTRGAATRGGEPTSVPAVAPENFVASTRARRGGAADRLRTGGGVGADSGAGRTAPPAAPHQATDDQQEQPESADAVAKSAEAPLRPTGRSRMVRRPRGYVQPSMLDPRGDQTGTAKEADGSAFGTAGPAATAGHGPAAPTASTHASTSNASSTGASGQDDTISIPAYRQLRHTVRSPAAADGAPDADAGAANSGAASRGRGHHAAMPPVPEGGLGGTGILPPEEAGYAALDLEQLAQFVLGRQASPEEVQDLARAVAQSEEVEAAFGDLASSPQLQGGIVPRYGLPPNQQPGHHRHRHPHYPAEGDQVQRSLHQQRQQKEEQRGHSRLNADDSPTPTFGYKVRRGRSGNRRRLCVPERVLQLAAKHWPEAVASGGKEGDVAELGGDLPRGAATSFVKETHRSGAMLSGLMMRRLGRRQRGRAETESPPAWLHRQPSLAQRKEMERMGEEMECAFRSAPPMERRAAEALNAFLRGRQLQELDEQQRGQQEAHPRRFGAPTPGRNRTGLPGLVPGRDAVVVLPRSLLEVVTGAWQQQEQLLMHEDYRVGR